MSVHSSALVLEKLVEVPVQIPVHFARKSFLPNSRPPEDLCTNMPFSHLSARIASRLRGCDSAKSQQNIANLVSTLLQDEVLRPVYLEANSIAIQGLARQISKHVLEQVRSAVDAAIPEPPLGQDADTSTQQLVELEEAGTDTVEFQQCLSLEHSQWADQSLLEAVQQVCSGNKNRIQSGTNLTREQILGLISSLRHIQMAEVECLRIVEKETAPSLHIVEVEKQVLRVVQKQVEVVRKVETSHVQAWQQANQEGFCEEGEFLTYGELVSRLESTTSKLNSRSEALASLEVDKIEKEELLEEFRQLISELEANLQAKIREATEAQTQVKASAKQLSQLEEENRKLTYEITEERTRNREVIQQLTAELVRLKESLASQQSHRSRVTKMLEQAEQQIGDLTMRENAIKNQTQELIEELNKSSDAKMVLAKEMVELQSKNTELARELNGHSDRATKFESEYQAIKGLSEELEQQYLEAAQARHSLEEEVTNSNTELELLQKQHQKLIAESERAHITIQTQRQSVKQLTRALESANSKVLQSQQSSAEAISQYILEIQEFKREIQSLNTEKQQLKVLINQHNVAALQEYAELNQLLTQDNHRQSQTIAALTRQLEETNTQLEVLKSCMLQSQEAAAETQELRRVTAEFEQEIRQLTASLDYYRRCAAEDAQAINQLTRQKVELMDKIEQLQELSKISRVRSKESIRIDKCKEMNDMIYKQNQQLLADVYEMCNKINQKDEIIAQLNTRLQQLEKMDASRKEAANNRAREAHLAHNKSASQLQGGARDSFKMSRTKPVEYSSQLESRPSTEVQPAPYLLPEDSAHRRIAEQALQTEIRELSEQLLAERANTNILTRQVNCLTEQLLVHEKAALQKNGHLNYINNSKNEGNLGSDSRVSFPQLHDKSRVLDSSQQLVQIDEELVDSNQKRLNRSCKPSRMASGFQEPPEDNNKQKNNQTLQTQPKYKFNFRELQKLQSNLKQFKAKTELQLGFTTHKPRTPQARPHQHHQHAKKQVGTLNFEQLSLKEEEINLPWLYTIMLRITEACQNMVLRFKEYPNLHPSQIVIHGLDTDKPDLLYLDIFQFMGPPAAMGLFLAPEVLLGQENTEATTVWNIGVLFDMLIHKGSIYYSSPQQVVDPQTHYVMRETRYPELTRLVKKIFHPDPQQRIKLAHLTMNLKYQLKKLKSL